MKDDSDVGMPSFELVNDDDDDEIETIGQTSGDS